MRRPLATSVASAALLAVAAFAAPPAAGEPAPQGARRPILIVVAASSPLTNITLDGARRIFIGEWPELRPLNLPPRSEERVALDQVLLGRGPDEVARYWIERRIRGQGGPPRVIPSASLVVKIVARVPGAVGYVVDTPLPEGVRALSVGGLLPTHPQYPLFLWRPGR